MDVAVLIKNRRIVTHSDEFVGGMTIKGEKIVILISSVKIGNPVDVGLTQSHHRQLRLFDI